MFVIGFILLTFAIISYILYNKGHVNVKNTHALEATPGKLYSFYINDPVSAHKKFDGKIIKLKGQVNTVTENIQKQQILLLNTSNPGGNINCTMEEPAKGIKPGDIIIIKGICNGMIQSDPDLEIASDVYLTRSVISE